MWFGRFGDFSLVVACWVTMPPTWGSALAMLTSTCFVFVFPPSFPSLNLLETSLNLLTHGKTQIPLRLRGLVASPFIKALWPKRIEKTEQFRSREKSERQAASQEDS